MLREVVSKNENVTLAEIAAFAEREHLSLPMSYCDFLAKYNGGRPAPSAFPIGGMANNPYGRIQVFFGLHAEILTSDLSYQLKDLPASVPPGIVPIACTEGADFICFDFRGDKKSIVYWDKRRFWGTEVWNEEDLYPIADSFEEFLQSLHDRKF